MIRSPPGRPFRLPAGSASTPRPHHRPRSSAATVSCACCRTRSSACSASAVSSSSRSPASRRRKTRLLAESRAGWDDRAELVHWRQGRRLPYGDGITFWALVKPPGPRGDPRVGLAGEAAAEFMVLQIHMSWPLLVAHAAFAWLSARRGGARAMAVNAVGFAGGFLVFAVLLIPTFVVFGLRAGSGRTLENLHPHWVNPWIAITILARLFSFASHEIWRFIAPDDGKRWMWLLGHVWIVPIAVVVWLAGIWQPIWMLREWFRTRSPLAEWRAIRMLVVGTVALVYASYWFVLEPSQAHAFYVVAPVAFMFAAYCWTFVDSPRWRRIAAVVLVLNIALHIGQAYIQAPMKSLYRNREVVAAAIRLKQPEMFAHRRPFAVAGGPAALQDPMRPVRPPAGRSDLRHPAHDAAGPSCPLEDDAAKQQRPCRLPRRAVSDALSGRERTGRRRAARSDRRGPSAGSSRPDGSERRAGHDAVRDGDDRSARRRSAAAAAVRR